MKISKTHLLEKLDQVDVDLLQLWVEDEGEVSDEQKWEIFVELLERRVTVLQTCRNANIKLSQEQCLPRWLARLTQSRKELRLREVKILYDELKRRRNVAKYRKVERQLEDDTV
ncbi:hypothetical protein GW915_09915 [bacterium]|nr:hypothetical protein [bacterium]